MQEGQYFATRGNASYRQRGQASAVIDSATRDSDTGQFVVTAPIGSVRVSNISSSQIEDRTLTAAIGTKVTGFVDATPPI
jgi:hypothetical protein